MTDQLDLICDQIRRGFDQKTALRDEALKQARELTRHASLAIRAIHREVIVSKYLQILMSNSDRSKELSLVVNILSPFQIITNLVKTSLTA